VRVRIIANPVAGGGRGQRMAAALHAAMQARGADASLATTTQRGDATAFAAAAGAEGVDVVISVGGDGTAHEIVNGMRGYDTPMALLAVGTANVVARQFRLPKRADAVADLVLAGKTVRMDLGLRFQPGEPEGERFLLGAGAGLDAAIVAKVESGRGRTSSLLRWVGPSISTILSYRYPAIRVIADGEVISETAQYAIIGNCVMSAAIFPATPHARTDDGLIDVCLLHELGAWKCAGLAFAVFSPRFTQRRDIVYRQARHVRMEPAGSEQAPLQVDGDPAGQLPMEFGVEPGALRLLVP